MAANLQPKPWKTPAHFDILHTPSPERVQRSEVVQNDPNPTLRAFHDAKYDVFRKLVDAQTDFAREMRDVPS